MPTPPEHPSPPARPEGAPLPRKLGLFDATMVGVGGMVSGEIFYLTGIAAGEGGPASLLAFALNGAVALLSALCYAELASAIPEAGGGYSFIRRAFRGAPGFLAGWMLWFAYAVACGLYALGFASYFWEVIRKLLPQFSDFWFGLLGREAGTRSVVLLVGLLFIALNVRAVRVSSRLENVLALATILILSLFVTFGLKSALGSPSASLSQLEPFFPKGLSGAFAAMGLTFIAFQGYELAANLAEEVREPAKNIPRAILLALGVVVTLYLLTLFVSLATILTPGAKGWEFLGLHRELAVVRVAESFMPRFGVILVVGGGLLSTASALNATLLAGSRLAFSMSRDGWLPRALLRVHPASGAPRGAVAATGFLFLAMGLGFPLELVGRAASVVFLLCFGLVSGAVVVLRRSHPDMPRRFTVPLSPFLPLLGAGASVSLALYQYWVEPRTWYIAGAWVAAGSLLYFARYRGKRAEPQPGLAPGTSASE